MGKIWIWIFYPNPPRRGVLKKWKFLRLVVEPKLLNMICRTYKEMTKSRRWTLYLKNWASCSNFRGSRYDKIYRVSQKNGTPHCGLICRLSLSFYNLIDTGPFFCVYQEKNMWWNLSENKKVAEILHFCSMEGIFKFMQIQTIKL